MNNHIIWSFTSSHGIVSYLVGTIHTSTVFTARLSIAIQPYLQEVSAYFGETDLDALPKSQEGFISSLAPTSSVLKPKDIQYNVKVMRSYGIHEAMIDSLLSLPFLFFRNSAVLATIPSVYLDEPHFDQQLYSMAKAYNLPTGGLEPVLYQDKLFEVLTNVPPEEIHFSFRKARQKTIKLIQHYEQQDIGLLHQTTRRYAGKYRKLLLSNRNQNMASTIIEKQQKFGSVMTSMGVSHLSGKFGVLRLLKKAGYVIRPVPLKL